MSAQPIHNPGSTVSETAVAVVDAETVDPDESFTREQERAAAMADGLRQLARFVEANPHLAEWLDYPLGSMNAPISRAEEPRPLLADFTRAALAAGGTVDKYYSGDDHQTWAGIHARFGPVRVQVYTYRAEVCERVVVGVEEVLEEVPDPEALAAVPKIKVPKTVERVEWVCTPLLAEAGADLGSAARS